MSEKELDRLIAARLTDTISEKESEKLEKWLSNPENRRLFKKLEAIWLEDSQEPVFSNTNSTANTLWSNSVSEKQRIPWRWIAAASVIILIGASLVFNYNSSVSTQEEVAQWATHQNPPGQKSKIHLSDGTVVWLNAQSTISYQKGFSDSARIVRLEGEAYFDVAKDHDRAFEVITNNISITALGTSFNVNTYLHDKSTRIALVTGKVGVKKIKEQGEGIILEPGEDAWYTPESDQLMKGKFNREEITGWKDGLLIFRRSPYLEVIDRLEQWYGVQIDTRGTVPDDWSLNARFDNQSLESILINLNFQKQNRNHLEL